MEFTIADKNMVEAGIFDLTVDIDVGKDNDMVFKIDKKRFNELKPYYIYQNGNEYGGILSKKKVVDDVVTVTVDLWRKVLGGKIIVPPQGEAYRTVKGKVNDILQTLVNEFFPDLFFFYAGNPDLNNTTVTFKFDRYTDLASGIDKLLRSIGYRLDLSTQVFQSGFLVYVTPVKCADKSAEYEAGMDGHVEVLEESNLRGVNHLICLGGGELQNRIVVDLYVDQDGSISLDPYYSGNEEITAVFDYGNAESTAELIEHGKERLRQLRNYKKLELKKIEDINVELGDLIGIVTDAETTKAEITRKIIKSNGKTRYEARMVR